MANRKEELSCVGINKFAHSFLILAVMPFVSCFSVEAVGSISNSQLARLEATVDCETGMCGVGTNSMDGVRENSRSLLHTVNMFASNGQDPMEYKPRTGVFSPIGRVEVAIDANDPRNTSKPRRAGFKAGSGFMISPCLMRTARHVVFGSLMDPTAADGKGITFSVGQGTGKSFKYSMVKATPILWSKARKNSSEDPGQELAVLKLDKCVGEDPAVGWGQIEVANSVNQTGLQIAGYPSGRDLNQLSVQNNCSLHGGARINSGLGNTDLGGYYTDCASAPGISGAPIFYERDGVPVVVAVHVQSLRSAGVDRNGKNIILRQYSLDYANVADNLMDQYDEVLDVVNDDIRRFGQPNPLDRSMTAQLERARLAAARPNPQDLLANQLALSKRAPQWIKDIRTGCQVWNLWPTNDETVTWTGSCDKNRLAEGRGNLTWQLDGKLNGRYDGEYRAGHKEGTGTSDSASGTHSSGQYHRDQLNGQGSVTQSNGDRHEGEYVDGKPNGIGRAVIGGVAYQGAWKDGCFRQANGTFVSFMVTLDTCR